MQAPRGAAAAEVALSFPPNLGVLVYAAWAVFSLNHQSVTTFAQWLTRTFAGSAAEPSPGPPDAATGATLSRGHHDRRG